MDENLRCAGCGATVDTKTGFVFINKKTHVAMFICTPCGEALRSKHPELFRPENELHEQ